MTGTSPACWQLKFDGENALLGGAGGSTGEGPRFRPAPDGGSWESPSGELIYEARRDASSASWSLADRTRGVTGSGSSLEPLGETGGVYYFLLADGRLFRLAPSGTRAGGFELTGWDLPGPYLIARPDPAGWSFVTQPAGRGLEDLRFLMFLVATRIITDDGIQAE